VQEAFERGEGALGEATGRRCHRRRRVERVMGIEPTLAAWESDLVNHGQEVRVDERSGISSLDWFDSFTGFPVPRDS
jgi:hypothetical protein